jgi:cobalamin biosynthesis protein CobD/CbiB
LEKAGHYRLGAGQRPPTPHDIGRSVSLMYAASVLAALLFASVAALRSANRRP